MRGASQTQQNIDERLRAVIVHGVHASVTPGEPFTVEHTLGLVPSFAAGLPFDDADVWSSEADRRVWNAKKIVLRCNVASEPMSVMVVE